MAWTDKVFHLNTTTGSYTDYPFMWHLIANKTNCQSPILKCIK